MEILCKMPWLWWLLWLLPLLIGAWLWWMGRNKYNKMVADYDGKIKGLNGRISGLEDDLAACKSKRSELEGDLAITKGRMREMEADMKAMKASGGALGAAALAAELSGTAALGAESAETAEFGAELSETAELGAELSDTAALAAEPAELLAAEPAELAAETAEHAAEPAELAAEVSDAAELAAETADAELGLGAGISSLSGSGASSKPEANIPKPAATKSIYSGIKSDNLQIIEGIGPKMESVLKENGVDSLATLGGKSADDIQAILKKYGDKYKIIDPKTWPNQAKLAGDKDFDGLIDYQKRLNTGKENASGMTDSKLEKYLIKTGAMKAFKQDDLKAIEGIGPATDKLLRENGITTWREMANSSADSIKAILTAAGSRFALGDPTTWPKQAELAADGKFDELREYQDFLDGGKG